MQPVSLHLGGHRPSRRSTRWPHTKWEADSSDIITLPTLLKRPATWPSPVRYYFLGSPLLLTNYDIQIHVLWLLCALASAPKTPSFRRFSSSPSSVIW